MLATPLGCVFASMAVKDGEETLASDASIVDDEGVRVFHVPTRALVLVHADLERGITNRMLV